MHDRSSRERCRLTVSLAVAFLLAATAFAAMQDRVDDGTVRILRGPLAATAKLRIDRFPIDGIAHTLELERFEVWAPNAEIIAEGNGVRTRLPVPATRFFRGHIAGQPDSMVFLSVDEGVTGLIISADRRYDVRTVRRARATKAAESDVLVEQAADDFDTGQGFTCGTEGRMITPPRAAGRVPQSEAIRNLIPVAQNGVLNSGTATHTLNLALEADSALYTNMGSSTPNVNTFIGNLVGAASTIYQRDLQTDLIVVFSRTQTNPGTDPFVYPNGSTITDADALAQLGDIWHGAPLPPPPSTTPHSAVVRLSGGVRLSGVAWIQTACKPDFHCGTPDPSCGDPKLDGHYGGEYAYCGGLGSTVTVPDPNAAVPASNFWPLLEFSHELGHVVSAVHTHCIPLNATDHTTWPASASRSYVDQCFSGECYMGPTSVPAEKGSIMSYCHNLGGGPQTRYLFGVGTDPTAKVINGNMGGAVVPNGGILPYVIMVTPDSPTIIAPASVPTGVPTMASINGPVSTLTYDWTITNGTIVGPTTGSSITFTGTANPATLRVRATINTAPATRGCAASDYKTITVTTACVAPAITAQPAGTSINQGQSATLSVTATGTTLNYQWYVGASGVTTNPVPGATSSSVTVGPGSTTTYWVRVSNGCGTVNSTAATVTVTPTATTAKFFLLAAPCRILDTRGGAALSPNSVRNLVAVGLCGLPSGITSIATNLTVVSPTSEAYVTVYPGPAGSPRPFASTINYTPGRTLANNAYISVATDGSINIFNSGSAPLDFLIDVNGYFK